MQIMDNMKNEIDALCVRLNEARDVYYNEDREIMSNAEFDDAMKYLANLEKISGYHPSNSPVGKVGPTINLPKEGRQEVIHALRARSLDKTKDPKEVISKLMLTGHQAKMSIFQGGLEAVGMWKLDGCTLILTYEKGELVLAATRGDGEVGTDVTDNTKYIAGIPQCISKDYTFTVRGECVISYKNFESINANLPEGTEPYANPRNLASASVSMPNSEDMKDRCLEFKAFDLIWTDKEFSWPPEFQGPYNMVHQFMFLKNEGFGVVDYEVTEVPNIEQTIERFTEKVKDYEYPVDGLVFALMDRALSKDLPGTEHHPDPKYGYAFKWADEEVETTLRDIEWSPSRTGLLNPVAIFDPIQIAGTTVSRASLHNISYIEDKFLNIGDRITVVKANLIIPQIIHNLSLDERPLDERLDNIHDMIPKHCPTCTAPTAVKKEGAAKMLYCTNLECPEKLIGNLAHFCSRDGMDIDGWSEQTLKKLIELHYVKEYKDIFLLEHHAGLAFVPGFGKRSWEKLYQAAEEARHTTFIKFVSALSIPGVGKGQAKTLKKYLDNAYIVLNQRYHIDGYHPFMLLVEMACNDFDLTVIDGIGPIMSDNIKEWFKQNFAEDVGSTPYKRLMSYIEFTDKEPLRDDFMNPPQSVLAGKSFCITGKLIHHSNRQELVDKIEANGGKWIDSVSSKTDYLINNDVTSTSGKNKKAHELNIPIISEEEFLSMLV